MADTAGDGGRDVSEGNGSSGNGIIRDRIKELRRVPARSLLANPKNWRRHPIYQREAVRSVLAEVGYGDALLARETSEGLVLIDGHLRAEITPDQDVPVLVLDVTEQADLLLATLDPLAAMATRDDDALKSLVALVEIGGDEVRALLNGIVGVPVNSVAEEWQGMPEFVQEDKQGFRSIIVHFQDEDAVKEFARIIGQAFSDKARFIWFPEAGWKGMRHDQGYAAGS